MSSLYSATCASSVVVEGVRAVKSISVTIPAAPHCLNWPSSIARELEITELLLGFLFYCDWLTAAEGAFWLYSVSEFRENHRCWEGKLCHLPPPRIHTHTPNRRNTSPSSRCWTHPRTWATLERGCVVAMAKTPNDPGVHCWWRVQQFMTVFICI